MSIQRGVATFTLDTGTCPRWLFDRMVRLGREMTRVLIDEYGPNEFIRRISDPVWFQSFGTVLAFDWNASGLTTILTAALKEAIRGEEEELGIFICGGKGKISRRTPAEITAWGERLGYANCYTNSLVYKSKMAAKVDSVLVQDGFQLYHHAFFFSRNGTWGVVQQGMNTEWGAARRYHWFSEKIEDLICEPHAGISSEAIGDNVLNLVAKESGKTREVSVDLVQSGYGAIMKEIAVLRRHSSSLSKMMKLGRGGEQLTLLQLEDREFKTHPVIFEDFSKSRYLDKILACIVAAKPRNYEQLVALEGVGPKTVRALALVGEVIYGATPSYEDPARYSFAHGGKDAVPYPVDRATYDETIQVLERAVRSARLLPQEKNSALRQVARLKQ